MNWRAWMTYSPDALAAEPEFRSAPTSPESAPTMGGEHARLLHDRADLPRVHGREVRRRRREVRGAFTRWTGKHLPELVLAKLRLPARPAACRSSRRIVLRIRRGLRRVRVTANGRRLRVRGRPNHRYVVIDLRGRGPRTVVVRVSGLDRKGHVTRRSHRYHRCR